MALPHIFGSLSGSAPTSYLDDNFNALGNFVPIQCTASGVTTIALTPVLNSPALSAYQQLQAVVFLAVGANGTPATVNLSGLGAKPLRLFDAASAIELPAGFLQANTPVLAIYDGNQFLIVGRVPLAPQRTVLLSGTGTYTTPVGAAWLVVRMVGGGGGGAGSGTAGTAGNGGNGGNTTFGTALLAANGGSAGVAGGSAGGGSGGTASGGSINLPGGQGGGASGTTADSSGGAGGSTPFGSTQGPAQTGNTGLNATAYGAGGSGASANAANAVPGTGGGGGGYVESIIPGPAVSYAYAVGTGGNGGTAGTGGAAGGAGAAGAIIVDAHF